MPCSHDNTVSSFFQFVFFFWLPACLPHVVSHAVLSRSERLTVVKFTTIRCRAATSVMVRVGLSGTVSHAEVCSPPAFSGENKAAQVHLWHILNRRP